MRSHAAVRGRQLRIGCRQRLPGGIAVEILPEGMAASLELTSLKVSDALRQLHQAGVKEPHQPRPFALKLFQWQLLNSPRWLGCR